MVETVFLGINDAGEQIYSWLNSQEDVEVKALLTEKEQLSLIKELEPELVISAGFEHKVPEEIIDIPEKGIVNVHPSYLPFNKGSHPYIWSIIDETPAGVSIHYMSPEIDEGPVIAKKEVMVTPEDTGKTLYNRLTRTSVQLFKDNWEKISNGVDAKPQEKEGTTHYSRELEEISELGLNEEIKVGDLINRLRALTFPPHKSAYFELYGKKYFVEIDIREEDQS